MKYDIGALHAALTGAGVDAIGISMPADVHDTHGPATFIQCDGALYRVDWANNPTAEQIALAVSTLGAGCVVVGSEPDLVSDEPAYFIPPPRRGT